MECELREDREIDQGQVLELYQANNWSSADKPETLMAALRNSHRLITAWKGDRLLGLGNAISDGHLVVYYAHMLVHPDFHGKGVGQKILHALQMPYQHFHQQILVADGKAIDFYQKMGFKPAGDTQALWIYQGTEH